MLLTNMTSITIYFGICAMIKLTRVHFYFSVQDNKDLELDIIPASLTDDPEVKLRDPNHEVSEEKRKSARKKE